MRKETTNLVIAILKDYPEMDKKLAQRKYELQHPFHERDENIGGGKAENKPWTYYDNLIITLDQDRQIRALEKEQEVIGKVLSTTGTETKKIITNLYLKKDGTTIQSLVAKGKIWCSVTKAYQLRDSFIRDVANKLNISEL